MNFFGGPGEPGGDYEEPQILRARPDRFPAAPQDWVLPKTLPLSLRLAEGQNVVLALQDVRCWPGGFTLSMALFLRKAILDGHAMSMMFHRHPHHRPKDGDVRLGVQFADGRRVTTLDDWRAADGGQPVMMPGAFGGGQFHFQYEVYISPIPPDGPLTIVVEWADQEIPETRTELDGTAIRAASAQAQEIWPDLPPARHHGNYGL